MVEKPTLNFAKNGKKVGGGRFIGDASDRVPSLAAQLTLSKKTIGIGIFELRFAILEISGSEPEFGVRRVADSTQSEVEFGKLA